jgi:hypothetical protein
VLGVILGVVLGANLVNAATPLPTDPGAVDPGPGIPNDPGPTEQPQPVPTPGPGETNTPIRTLPPLGPVETAAPLDPGPVQPGEGVDVGAGYVLFPPEGWTVVGGEEGLTVFQKNGVLLIVGGFAWNDSAPALATTYRDAWFTGGQFTGDDPQTGSIGNGIPAAALNYTGVVNGTQVDGLIVAGSVNGSGLIVNVFGASGSLAGVSTDLDTIFATVQQTGG